MLEHQRNLTISAFWNEVLTSNTTINPDLWPEMLTENSTGIKMRVFEGRHQVKVETEPGLEKNFSLKLCTARKENILVETVAIPCTDIVGLSDEKDATWERKIRISSTQSPKIKLTCCTSEIGQHNVPLIVKYYEERENKVEVRQKQLKTLVIEMVIVVQNKECLSMLPCGLTEEKNVTKGKWEADMTVSQKVPCELLDDVEDYLLCKIPLEFNKPSELLREQYQNRFLPDSQTEDWEENSAKIRKLFKEGIKSENYEDFFKVLLQCEQLEEEKKIIDFDINQAEVKLSGCDLLVLETNQNQLPRIRRGDMDYLHAADSKPKEFFKAWIHKVAKGYICIILCTCMCNFSIKYIKF